MGGERLKTHPRRRSAWYTAPVRRFTLAAFAALMTSGCLVNPPPAEGLCRTGVDCREGRVCLCGTCVDGGTVPPFAYRFRQPNDGFERNIGTNAVMEGGADGGVFHLQLPSGATPRSGLTEIRDELAHMPRTAQGRVAGRITFTGGAINIDDNSGVHVLNLDAPLDAGMGARSFASLVVRAADRRLLLQSEAGQLSTTDLNLETDAGFTAGKTAFVELCWNLGTHARVRVDGVEVLRTELLPVPVPSPRVFRTRVGLQNYAPPVGAATLSADFANWQVTDGPDDQVKDLP